MSAKLSILTDTEKAVVQTITMKLLPEQALTYLKDCGIKMARRSYFRYKKKVESMKWERLVHTANLFTEQHLQRLDKLELIKSKYALLFVNISASAFGSIISFH